MTVTVFSKPSCVQCNATKKALTKRNVNFVTVDITQDDEARDFVMGLGYVAAPVVLVEDEGTESAHWSGFRPDRINSLVTA